MIVAPEWPVRTIDELCLSIVDCVNRTAPVIEGPTPFRMIRTTNVRDGFVDLTETRFVEEETFKTWTRRQIPRPGDVILTREAPLGEVGLLRAGAHAFLGQRLVSYRVNPALLDNRFLLYYLRSDAGRGQVLALGSGSTVHHMRVPEAKRLRIPTPLIAEQRRIGSILGAYDDLIEVNRRRVALLENMARSLFEEWFVRFRFPGRESVAVIEAPGGLLPQGWVQTPIESAFSIIGGGTPAKVSPDFWDGGSINWFTPSDLTKAKAVFFDVSGTRITPLGLRSSSANLFPPNSIMMTSRATLGVIAINSTAASTNQGFITCIPNARVPLAYLYHWLGKNVPVFISYATGATFKEITKGVFKKLLMDIPPETLTQAFEKVARPMLDTIQTIERSNRTLAASRDLLLPRLISGQLSVKAAERKFEEAA